MERPPPGPADSPPASARPGPAERTVPRTEDDRDTAAISWRTEVCASPETLWATLRDVPRMVAALPGAALAGPPDDMPLRLRLSVAIGPMRPSFDGEAEVSWDDETRSGRIEGRAEDNASRSSAEGRVRFRVLEAKDDTDGATLDLAIHYRIRGPLAQFSRGPVVDAVMEQLLARFAANLEAAATGEAIADPPPPGAIHLLLATAAATRPAVVRRLIGPVNWPPAPALSTQSNRIQLRCTPTPSMLHGTDEGPRWGTVTRRDKLIRRFRSRPRDLAWDELVRLLEGVGYIESRRGRTGGSRRRFVHPDAPAISLHKPHPGNIVKMYVIDEVSRLLHRGEADMSNLLEYRGYLGSVLFSDEDETFFGRLEFIRDLVTYEGSDARALKSAFREAVDDYLGLCEDEGREPEVPLKGSFNVRPGQELHRRAMLYARREGMSLNAVVTDALRRFLENDRTAA